ncbi:MAG: inositol monophosphatase family protein [Candidatus Uhrbacteria bacterium]
MSGMDFGPLSGRTIGVVMREALRRGDRAVVTKRFGAAAHAKGVKDDGGTDFFTDADTAAQLAIVTVLRENFPTFGLVGEEDGLRVACDRDAHKKHDLWFTIDPIDGTLAFMREQSHGIGGMIALVCDGEVIGAYVRDLCTHEVYGFRPGSTNAHRIMPTDEPHRLAVNVDRPLVDQYLLLRDPPEDHDSELVMAMSRKSTRGGAFKNHTMANGSIGISMAQLWKGEVGAAVLKGTKNTPWDFAPVYGISRKLGFRFFSIVEDREGATCRLLAFHPSVVSTIEPVDHPLLVVHESRIDELDAWIATRYR